MSDSNEISSVADRRRPAELMAAPVVMVALLALVVNDHWLKQAHPSWMTGKLSDVAGLVLAPVLLVSFVEAVAWMLGRAMPDSRRLMAPTSVAVGVAFVAVQIMPTATDAYATIAGHTARLVAQIVPIVSSGGGPAAVTADPTDLLALIALAVPMRLSRTHD